MAYTGIYERTIFYNPVNKYSVISVKTSDRSIPEKARSAYRHRDNMIHFAAVGYELPRTDQVSMILDGEWKEGKNGFQLHVTKCEEVVPQTREGIKGYLSSRLIKGIGGKTAELIVDRFGADTLHVLENEPERLLEIRGVSKAKLEEIIASYNESRTLRDLMLLLAPFQITPTTATKIYDHFGAHSVDILRDNPFELCQVSGFGFKRVDAIMRKNNWPLNSPMRIRGAVFAALEGAKGDGGHLYLDAEQLRKESMALLNSMIPVPQMRVKADDLEAVIDDMLLQGKIINSNGNYYLVKTFAQEDETARSIARLLCRPVERVNVQDLLTRVSWCSMSIRGRAFWRAASNPVGSCSTAGMISPHFHLERMRRPHGNAQHWVPWIEYEQLIAQMREAAEKSDLPIDGLVLTYDEVDYSRTCGRTGHHFKDGLAFKFEDELYESVLRDIEWTPSRTGEIAPVAVLNSVVIDGCSVSRASLHNLSFIEGLELMPGCRVLVSKRNMIIPHIEENLERGHFDLDAVTPKHCPCCGAETRFHITDGGKKALFCDNPACAMRKLRRFVHFASKKAMDIEGLSEATLERLIARGWLHSFTDVYRLDHYMQEIICMDGFGKKSWDSAAVSSLSSRQSGTSP